MEERLRTVAGSRLIPLGDDQQRRILMAVVVNEQDESFKIQDLERKIFTPTRNRIMCEAFLAEAQNDPTGAIGKSIVFAVNQKHATNLTKIFNELQPGLAVTITSRIPGASSIAKEFRDGKRSERIAVSVDMHLIASPLHRSVIGEIKT